jgi:predicted nucleic acid-binding protein
LAGRVAFDTTFLIDFQRERARGQVDGPAHAFLNDEETAPAYGRITRSLRAAGTLIGANDLWIAATSIRHEVPLVTVNVAEFRRVEGIQILPYR